MTSYHDHRGAGGSLSSGPCYQSKEPVFSHEVQNRHTLTQSSACSLALEVAQALCRPELLEEPGMWVEMSSVCSPHSTMTPRTATLCSVALTPSVQLSTQGKQIDTLPPMYTEAPAYPKDKETRKIRKTTSGGRVIILSGLLGSQYLNMGLGHVDLNS